MRKECISLKFYELAILFFCMVCLSSAKAQEKYYLEYRNKGFGLLNKSYFLNDSKITKDSVAKLLERDNKSACYMFTKGRKNLTGAILIVIPSMVLLTAEVLRPFNNGANPGSGLIIAASAGVVGSIVLAFIADGQFEKAATI